MRRLILALMFTLVATSLWAQQRVFSNQEQVQKLNACYRYLQQNYVDEISLDKCVEEAIRATLKELDPHSTYLSREEMEAAMGSLNGGFSGIGITYTILGDTVVVRKVNDDSPAQRAGVGQNDRIIAIDGKPISEYSDILGALRGPKGSKVKVDVIRARTLEHSTATITRGNIEVSSIAACFKVAPKVGYIKISTFARNTADEFIKAVKKLGRVETLIVDLRGNSGGMLPAAIKLSEHFLDKHEVVVSTEGRNEVYEYAAQRRGELFGTPVIVLINESSASASEIFAGALQDHDRGVIVGNTSFGKGLVQRQVSFDDGSAMRITVARYKTPSGRLIQRPYDNGKSDEYYRDISRYNHPDSMRQDTLPIHRTIRSGRTVYGGGGITPDVYITHDTTTMPAYMTNVVKENIIQRSLIELWDTIEPKSIRKRYPTIETYDANYEVSDIAIDAFCRMVESEDARNDNKYTIPLLKAYIAEDVYGTGSYEYIYNRHHDKVLIRAIELATRREEMESILGIAF